MVATPQSRTTSAAVRADRTGRHRLWAHRLWAHRLWAHRLRAHGFGHGLTPVRLGRAPAAPGHASARPRRRRSGPAGPTRGADTTGQSALAAHLAGALESDGPVTPEPTPTPPSRVEGESPEVPVTVDSEGSLVSAQAAPEPTVSAPASGGGRRLSAEAGPSRQRSAARRGRRLSNFARREQPPPGETRSDEVCVPQTLAAFNARYGRSGNRSVDERMVGPGGRTPATLTWADLVDLLQGVETRLVDGQPTGAQIVAALAATPGSMVIVDMAPPGRRGTSSRWSMNRPGRPGRTCASSTSPSTATTSGQ